METLEMGELKKIPIFQNLDDGEMSEILKLSNRQNYAKDDSVFKQDEEAKMLFIENSTGYPPACWREESGSP